MTSVESFQIHLRTKDLHKLRRRGWEKVFQVNGHEKKAGVVVLISNKIDFKTKAIKRDKEGHYIILTGIFQQEDITFINIYAPNIGTPKYIRKILENFKKEIDSNIVIIGNFNTTHQQWIDHPNQKLTRILWH